MTYCLAVSTKEGLVFCSDSRTNSGADILSVYSKMHIFKPASDRIFVLLTSGNLATTQAIVQRITHELEEQETPGLLGCEKMTDAARYVSNVNRSEQEKANALTASASDIDTSATLIFGGQIAGAPPAIYLLYSAGNYISDSDQTPYLQIGESKYGKPILDRIITRKTSLEDAARCSLVSMDSTIKSNATVGPPIEMMMYKADNFTESCYLKLNEDDDYLREIRQSWNEALQKAFSELPPLKWDNNQGGESDKVRNIHKER